MRTIIARVLIGLSIYIFAPAVIYGAQIPDDQLKSVVRIYSYGYRQRPCG